MNKQEFQYDFIKISFSFMLSSIFALISVLAVKFFYHQNTSDILIQANNISGFVGGIDPLIFHPETKEKLIFFVLFSVFLSSFFIITKITQKWNFKFSDRLYIITGISDIAIIILLTLFTYLSSDKYPVTDQIGNYFDLYQNNTFMQNNIFFYFIICAALWSFSLVIFLKKPLIATKFENIFKFIIIAIILMVILSITIDAANFTYSFAPFHFDAVFYSVYQLNTTHQPMLVDGFSNTYGLYPHFINLFFKTSTLTTYNFTMFFSIILGISFLSIYCFMYKSIKYPIITLIGFSGYIFAYLNARYLSNDPYFQYMPLRTFFPLLILFLCAVYAKRESKLMFVLNSILSSISILWQPDSGITIFIVWISLLFYLNFDSNSIKKSLKNIFLKISTSVFIIFTVFLIYIFEIYLFYNRIPDLTYLFSTINMFSNLGLALLPIDYSHPWIIYLIIALIALVISLNSFFNKTTQKNPSLFIFAMYTIGCFFYFQGRSHSFTFLNIYGNIFVIISLIANILITKIKNNPKDLVLNLFLFLIIYSTSFSIFYIFKTQYKFWINNNRIYNSNNDSNHTADINLIKKYTEENEKILIIDIVNQGNYLAETKTISAFNTGCIDIFYKSDYMRLIDTIKNGNYKIFISHYPKKDDEIMKILNEKYTLIEQGDKLFYYKK